MSKGTASFGKRRKHAVRAVRGSRCASCGFPSSRIRKYSWSEKAIRRKTAGTGRMRHLRHVAVIFKFNFREGTEPRCRLRRFK